MKKALLMDLGNTIVRNLDFDFYRGLKHIYGKAIEPKIFYGELLEFNDKLKVLTYENKDEYEISLKSYLNYIKKYFDLSFNQDLESLELEFVSKVERLELMPGVLELFKYCKKKNIKIVVLSNTSFSAKAIYSQIEKFHFMKYIDNFLLSSEYIFRKPNKAFFELGIKVTGRPVDDILYIGDNYQADILGGIQSGLDVCWYNEKKEDNYLNLDCLDIQNYCQLIKYLEGNYD